MFNTGLWCWLFVFGRPTMFVSYHLDSTVFFVLLITGGSVPCFEEPYK